jgi:hypothetical protein
MEATERCYTRNEYEEITPGTEAFFAIFSTTPAPQLLRLLLL